MNKKWRILWPAGKNKPNKARESMMDKSNASINIISFGFEPYTVSVCDAVARLGNPVRSLSPQLWLGGESTYLSNMTVLVLTAHRPIQEELHDTIIRKISWSPHLAVFSYPITDGIQKILLCCQECCSWPCEQRELALRLERLSSLEKNLETTTSDITNSGIWGELNLIGTSPTFRKALSIIEISANCDVPVLIEGETGTGKELAARAIHHLSARRDYPFIPVNCGAIPDSLIENELFGHERGAYTDAQTSVKGLIARAEGGILFLDEIDSLSAMAQVVLLRFLQDRQFSPLGGRHLRDADVRVIAASNRSVSNLVQRGEFRQDLFFRLNVMPFKMPPLRERRDDVVLIAERIIYTFRQRYQQPSKQLHSSMIRFIQSREWPGNVRELENFLHREFLLAESDQIVASADPTINCERRFRSLDRRQSYLVDLEFGKAKAKLIEDFERKYLRSLLDKTAGNVSSAAKIAGKERRAFGRLLKKHRIRRDEFAS